MDVITSLQSAIEIVGKLRALSKKIEDADFKMLVADLSVELADAKLETANLKIALAEALEENESQKKIIHQKSSQTPKLSDGAYGFDGEDGLFCTACFDTKSLKVRVSPLSGAFRTFGKWSCPSCQATLG